MVESTTFEIAMVREPFALASRWAAVVSAVSPDCVITMVSSPGPIRGLRYSN